MSAHARSVNAIRLVTAGTEKVIHRPDVAG